MRQAGVLRAHGPQLGQAPAGVPHAVARTATSVSLTKFALRYYQSDTVVSPMGRSLFGPGLTLLIEDGELVLGTWQGVFLAEWDGPRTRRIAVKVMGG